MNFLSLLISIFGSSAGYTIDKLNFRQNRIGFREMMLLGFLAMVPFLLLFILLTNQPAPNLTFVSVGLLVLISLFSFGGNVFDYLSLKVDDVSLREPLIDFQPVLAGLVGYIVYPAERKTPLLIAFMLGTLVVRWGIHRRKLRRVQRKGMGYLFMAIALYAVLPSFYKEALIYVSPAYISLFRVALIIIFTTMIFPLKSLRGITPKRTWYCVLGGAAYSVAAIAGLYAIEQYGVVLTMVFLMLTPALHYLAGQFILKEKLRKGEVLSSLMLTLIVAIAAFMN